ncbi:aspartate-semialdehyde dehydrogenase [Rudaeicoccus suwonensis]|uniref:Aspartate semialdehyde dehydrogenase n=1 Tax=Rudaeicoccus suwonensis TaxID=657409 RepID=A0A561E392_9MICO|nr:aspartate-semialdehyde dehydrogenase [Rudaeicoccus suwonensis]TWE10077.1 aspartate semialdehyde dehydrogenase [Rudaeicoccus suwonensis]
MGQSKPTLALVGATGVVGLSLLSLLPTRDDVWGEIRPIASDRSVGRRMSILGHDCLVQQLSVKAFEGADVVVMAVPADVAEMWTPVAVAAGAVVIDNSGRFVADPDVPLVVPEINPDAARHHPAGIVASPSGATLMMVGSLASLHATWQLTSVVATTFQAVTDAGIAGAVRLYAETMELAGNDGVGQSPGDVRRMLSDLGDSPFPAPVAYNVIPWVGEPAVDGATTSELAVRDELRSLLRVPDLPVAVTCVQVPVVRTHSVSLHATFAADIQRDDAVRVLTESSNSVVVLDGSNDTPDDEWPMPVDVVGADPVFAGRVRQLEGFPRSIELFICADNLRKGSALNALQVAELVI